jgi:peptidoglycan-N-acetylglucosamine deacetylase
MKSGNGDVGEQPDSPHVARKIKGRNIASLRFLMHALALIVVRVLGFLRRKALQKEIDFLRVSGHFLSTGNCHVAQVALTFDDGPHPSYTPQILEILQRYGIKANFFCVGQQVATYPDIVKQAYLGEHLIGNHSWSHPILALLSRSALRSQLTRTSDTIEQVLGVRPVYFRPPSSILSLQVLRQTHQLGMKTVLWDVEAKDWANPGIATIANHVLDQAKHGSIIILHDGGSDRSQTVAALPAIIEGLQQRGFQFITLDEVVKDFNFFRRTSTIYDFHTHHYSA